MLIHYWRRTRKNNKYNSCCREHIRQTPLPGLASCHCGTDAYPLPHSNDIRALSMVSPQQRAQYNRYGTGTGSGPVPHGAFFPHRRSGHIFLTRCAFWRAIRHRKAQTSHRASGIRHAGNSTTLLLGYDALLWL